MVSSGITSGAGAALPEKSDGGSLSAAGNASDVPYRWIINPTFDLLFVAGGAFFLLVAINYLCLGMKVAAYDPRYPLGATSLLFVIAFLAVHALGDSHIFATFMRIWSCPEDKKRFAFYRVWLTAVLIPLFIIGMNSAVFTGALLSIFLLTAFWHWTTQAFGISLIYCQKHGYSMTAFERDAFRWFMRGLAGYFIIRMLVFPDRYVPSNFAAVPVTKFPALPEPVHAIASWALILVVSAFVAITLRKLVTERKFPPLPVLSMIAVICCFGFAEDRESMLIWFYGPAFFHGSQYLAVTLSYHLKQQGLPEGMPTSQISRLMFGLPGLKYMAIAIAGGIVLYVGIPAISALFGYDRIMVLGLVFSLLSLHHIITDAAIWRLRDPQCRRLLIS